MFPRKLSRVWLQYAAAISATLTMFISGMQFAWTSPTLVKLYAPDSPIPTTPEQGSWLASLALAADLFGAPTGAWVSSKFGRKTAILFTAVPYLISWFLISIANHINILIIARFIAGFADGSTFTIVPMYIGEIAEVNIRGKLGTIMTVFLDCGSLVMYTVGPFTSISNCGVIGTTFPILLIATFMWMPESPYYLLMKKKPDKAKKNLQKLRGTKDVEREFNEAQTGVLEHSKVKFKDLFTVRSNLKALLIVLALKTIQMLSGIFAIMAYAQLIFEESSSLVDPHIAPIVVMSLKLITCLISGQFVDSMGRIPIMIISCSGCFVALSCQAVYFYLQTTDINLTGWTSVPICALSSFIVFYNIGLGIIPMIVSTEVFSTDVKPYALCIADLYLALVGSVVIKCYQLFADTFGNWVPYAVFATSCFVGAVFAITLMPETKEKSLEEIQEMLKNNSKTTKSSEINTAVAC